MTVIADTAPEAPSSSLGRTVCAWPASSVPPSGPTPPPESPSSTSLPRARRKVARRRRSSRSSGHLRGFDTEVGGIAAELIDVKAGSLTGFRCAGLMIVITTLVLLFLMTGSLVVPINAVVMNVLSLGASFGALAWIFQEGHLAGVLGFDSVGALDLWMPVLILIFAFGLSMDYEVFLLSRIKEVHDETGDSDLAVAVGLQRSGRIITRPHSSSSSSSPASPPARCSPSSSSAWASRSQSLSTPPSSGRSWCQPR